MKNAILIPGTPEKEEYYNEKEPSGSNAHWFPRITKKLIIREIHTVSLEIPKAYEPEYSIWKKEFERFEINSETLLVGHSYGGGFLLRWLSENPLYETGKIILIAPRLNPFDEIKEKTFFNFTFDPNLLKRDIQIFHSEDDMPSIQVSLKKILQIYPDFKVKYFKNYGHFCQNDLKSEKFPELLEEILF